MPEVPATAAPIVETPVAVEVVAEPEVVTTEAMSVAADDAAPAPVAGVDVVAAVELEEVAESSKFAPPAQGELASGLNVPVAEDSESAPSAEPEGAPAAVEITPPEIESPAQPPESPPTPAVLESGAVDTAEAHSAENVAAPLEPAALPSVETATTPLPEPAAESAPSVASEFLMPAAEELAAAAWVDSGPYPLPAEKEPDASRPDPEVISLSPEPETAVVASDPVESVAPAEPAPEVAVSPAEVAGGPADPVVETEVAPVPDSGPDSASGIPEPGGPVIETPAEAIPVEEPVKQDAEATPTAAPADAPPILIEGVAAVPVTPVDAPASPAEQPAEEPAPVEVVSALDAIAADIANDFGLEKASWIIALKFAAGTLAGNAENAGGAIIDAFRQDTADARESMDRATRRATNEAFPDFPNDQRVAIARHLASVLKEMVSKADSEHVQAAITEALE